MGRVSRNARLLFILLWTIADDHGRTRAHSRMLASLLFPYDDDAGEALPSWMSELENEGCIRLYEVNGSQYMQIVGWTKHQKIDKPSKPQFPEPSCDTRELSRDSLERSSEEGIGREGKGEDRKGEELRLTPLRVADEARHAVNGFQPIIDAYHEALPNCLRITVLNPKRKRRLAAVRKLAKQVCESQGWVYDEPQFFAAYWAECSQDPWMRGEVSNPNNPRWKQNLDVLLAEDRFALVMDRAIESMRADA